MIDQGAPAPYDGSLFSLMSTLHIGKRGLNGDKFRSIRCFICSDLSRIEIVERNQI
ncbi:hypothetical protein V144x_54060 [Gimesia aquarii]|uniref:Uncharacterized protein n=1 Tax=Gimesia aquarii TaxID=2527964 RepID=A0A517W3R2_9PLAN|nr:hypothetical protein V144x_17260 [Gimesia aquarii]QDT99892.1 hypothetical protein V144x_54060 [Gimesia aquarii]